jgi:hypothetical protein
MNFSKKKPNFIFFFDKKIFSNFMLFNIILFLIISCGESSDKSIAKASSDSSLEEKSTLKSSGNCLDKYYGNPEELLTQDLIGVFVDFEGAEVEVAKVSEQIMKGDMAQVNCKWKTEGKSRTIRLKQIKKIRLYDKTPVDQFHFQYHTRTKEEQAELTKALDKEVEKKTTDEKAEKITDAIGMDFAYIKVDGLGHAAVWEPKNNDLKVLVGEYQFTLNVDLEKENDFDLEKAKLIAQAIIDKACN